ncbi:hypothetical protein H0H93_001098, partial [Arthromyces matolae]
MRKSLFSSQDNDDENKAYRCLYQRQAFLESYSSPSPSPLPLPSGPNHIIVSQYPIVTILFTLATQTTTNPVVVAEKKVEEANAPDSDPEEHSRKRHKELEA